MNLIPIWVGRSTTAQTDVIKWSYEVHIWQTWTTCNIWQTCNIVTYLRDMLHLWSTMYWVATAIISSAHTDVIRPQLLIPLISAIVDVILVISLLMTLIMSKLLMSAWYLGILHREATNRSKRQMTWAKRPAQQNHRRHCRVMNRNGIQFKI